MNDSASAAVLQPAMVPPLPKSKEQYYRELDLAVEGAIRQVCAYMHAIPEAVIRERVTRAYLYARDAHEGCMRKSGEPYIIHPVLAMLEVLKLRPDLVTIESTLLHDVPEDTDRTLEEIETVFGKEVAYITAGVEKVSRLKYRGEERNIGSLRKMFIAMSEDIRVIFVKLADRMHNMRTIDFHPQKEKRDRIALETLNIYAPIADRLGLFGFKEDLEDACFRTLLPEKYEAIRAELDAMRLNQESFVTQAKQCIQHLLEENNIRVVDISHRVKSPYSIYRKMMRKGYEKVGDLHDLFAIRVITDSVADCYDILGVIHNRFTPLPKRFKDYIALPKENHYQSLHTTVVGIFRELGGAAGDRHQPTEIQIRTRSMHENAEIGIAAHFTYSESGKSGVSHEVSWVSELKEILESSQDSDFMSRMKISIFDDRIFVFTPKGDIKNLPKGSSPVDFAYAVHSDIGNRTAIAKVNGRVVPLDHELHSGDQVEIIIDRNKRPAIAWLSFVKTVRAKDVIRAYINRERREELLEKGRFIMNAYLQKHFGKALDRDLTLFNHLDGHAMGTKDKEDVLVQIGNLSRRPGSVIRGIEAKQAEKLQLIHDSAANAAGQEEKTASRHTETPGNSEGRLPRILVGKASDVPYVLAQCCKVVEGTKIVAHVGRAGVVKIHAATCSSLKRCNIERIIPAQFENQPTNGMTVSMELVIVNRLGVLKQLGEVFYAMRLEIEDFHTERLKDSRMRCAIILRGDEEDYYVFERLSERLSVTIPDIESIRLLSLT